MISLERSLPVNSPGQAHVTRADVWRGLVLKADNALPFVPAITYCKVTRRDSATQFVREIELKGDRMTERVTLAPERQVTFERLSGPVLGTIRNFIDEDAKGNLSLRFSFELEIQGGHEAIQGAIGGLWSAIDGLRHRFVHVWDHGATTVLEAAVTYFRKDGKTVTVPCVSILETRGGKVAELRVHIDLAPVFA